MTSLATCLRAAEIMLLDYMSVRKNEHVLFTADTATDPLLLSLLSTVVQRVDAHPVIATAPQLPFQGLLADPYISRIQVEAAKSCDVWIDLAFPYFGGSLAYDEVMRLERTRYLLAGDLKMESFGRLFGLLDLDRYFAVQNAFDALFDGTQGKEGRITSCNGTAIAFKLAGRTPFVKPRRAEKPGMYLVPGACSIPAQYDTIRGQIVVVAAFHEYHQLLADPITVSLDGAITKLSGGGPSRVVLERAMRRASKGNLGSIIHLTHGIHPAARLTGTSFIEDMRAHGSNAVGLGIPWNQAGGGENHPDAVLTEQSLWIDGQRIIADGVIVAPDALAASAQSLVPRIESSRDSTN
jgi:2,5-dihydroxypyridine 5,6-dioxygenase